MPQHKSCKKRLRTAEKSRIRNKMARSAIQTSLKKITQSESKEAVLSEMPTLFSLVDKAVLKGRAGFTKNKASNYKAKAHSHLAKIVA